MPSPGFLLLAAGLAVQAAALAALARPDGAARAPFPVLAALIASGLAVFAKALADADATLALGQACVLLPACRLAWRRRAGSPS